MTEQPNTPAPDIQFGRPFVLVRDIDISGVSGVGIVANGIEFPDGHAVIHWTGHEHPTTTAHPDGMKSVLAIHGHAGATRVVWQPAAIPQAKYGEVWPELVGYVQDAVDNDERIDAVHLAIYMRELRRKALAPTREWVDRIVKQGAGEQP